MVYFDPPYGISFKSTMQVSTKSRSNPENEKGISGDPEMVRAFRDTYERGIHDYLDGIRENVVIARSLLAETGSLFLQIGAKNIHKVSLILDEIFGDENRIATVTFRKSASSSTNLLPEVADYLLWYAKDRTSVRFHSLYQTLKKRQEIVDFFSWHAMIEEPDGNCRPLSSSEQENPDSISNEVRLFRRLPIQSQGWSTTGRSEPYEWNGRKWFCRATDQWSVSHEGLDRLAEANRLISAQSSEDSALMWKQYENEVPGRKINNVWDEHNRPNDMHYVVETAEKVIEKCMLMSTDPGDLVLDITCGSGTTPFVAEKWGRRWIATDTSRIPIALTRQRILTGIHDWHVLCSSREGAEIELDFAAKYGSDPLDQKRSNKSESKDPAVGFVYKRVPYVSAGHLAYDKPPKYTYIVNEPFRSKERRFRLASAFTVESHSPYRTLSPADYLNTDSSIDSKETIIQVLVNAGVQLQSGKRVLFSDIEPIEPNVSEGVVSHICESRMEENGDAASVTAALSILPDDATASQNWIREATRVAAGDPKIERLIVIAFNYESDALTESPLQRGRIQLYCVRAKPGLNDRYSAKFQV